MIPREEQSDIAAVTVSHYVNGAEAKLLDDCCRIVCHDFVGESPGAVWTMTAASLIDPNDRAIGSEIVPLLCEAVIKEQHPAVQKHNRRPVAERLGVHLGTRYLGEALSGTGAIRVCGCGREHADSGERCA